MNNDILTPPFAVGKPNFERLPEDVLPDALQEHALQNATPPPDNIIGRANRVNAHRYIRNGWAPIPVPIREKAPRKGWNEKRVTEDNIDEHFAPGQPSNIGVLLGELSGGLVDIDLDDAAAVRTARFFWPLDVTFGRHSKPHSHVLVVAIDSVPNRHAFKHALDGRMLLEVRGTGAQTIFPHSLHPSGELVHWHNRGKPPRIPGLEIMQRARLHATAVQLVEFYPHPGSRHDFSLAAAGFFATLRLPLREARLVFEAMASAAQDEEAADRLRALEDTYKRHETGQPTTGGPTLEQWVDRRVLDKIRSWWWQNESRVEIHTAPREEIPPLPPEEARKVAQAITTKDDETRPDLPEDALDGRLGELYQRHLAYLPRAYGWPSLLAFASVLVPSSVDGVLARIRPSLFVVIVGPPESGKSTGIKHAAKLLGLDNDNPLLLRVNPGSFEGLAQELDVNGEPRLLDVDELARVLKKAQIEHSSLAHAFNTLFYESTDRVIVARRKKYNINVRLSIIGSVVEDDFDGAFANTALTGLYSRFLIGLCPRPWTFRHPLRMPPSVELHPRPVDINPDEINAALDAAGLRGRVREIVLRVAYICASIDGRGVLRPEDLKPHFVLGRYLEDVRAQLTPPTGRTLEGQCEDKIIRTLEKLTHETGSEWVPLRIVRRRVNPSRDNAAGIFGRVVEELVRRGEIERKMLAVKGKNGQDYKIEMIRRAPPVVAIITEAREALEEKYRTTPQPPPKTTPQT